MRNILISVPGKKEKLPLSVTHPQLAKEADGWDPDSFTAGSHSMLNWICSSGHRWNARLSSRTGKDTNGCSFCSGKKVLPGTNDLKTLFPEIADEADGWDPSSTMSRSAKKMPWKCSLGHKWLASVANRTSERSTGCGICANRTLLKGFNDLGTKFPEIATEAFEWDPTSTLAGSASKKNWRCSKGHIFSATIDSRTSKRKSGCPVCSGQKLVAGVNDLKSTHPDIAKEAFGWDPSSVHAGTQKKAMWQCPKGHHYESLIKNRTRTNTGCHFCSNLKLLVGYNDLQTTHPGLAEEADGWNPIDFIAGSHKTVHWKCKNGHRWKTKLASRTGSDLTGCPSCATSGFDPNQSAFLYFLIHRDWEMLQIGITNVPDGRLVKHSKLGWELLELRGPMDGHITRQWETAILQMLKAKGADLSNSKIAGKFDGYSEAWSQSTFEVRSLKELLRLTEEYENNT